MGHPVRHQSAPAGPDGRRERSGSAQGHLSTSFDLIERPVDILSLGEIFGPGSTFALNGDEHLNRRKLLAPAFHGKQLKSYERIVEEEVMYETATWREGEEFETEEPMLRLTLGTILRAVFGAEGAALDELRGLMPVMVKLGSRLVMMPPPVRRDYGPWSPGGRLARYRRRFDAAINSLIADARDDPNFEERGDMLAVLMRARYNNGEQVPDSAYRRRATLASSAPDMKRPPPN